MGLKPEPNEKGSQMPSGFNYSGIRLNESIQHPKQRGLARPIGVDQAKAVPPSLLEAHILHRPELVMSQLHIGAAMWQSVQRPPAMVMTGFLAAQVLQAISERTFEAEAEPIDPMVNIQ